MGYKTETVWWLPEGVVKGKGGQIMVRDLGGGHTMQYTDHVS